MVRFGLGSAEFALLIEVRLITKAHADDRGGHADDDCRHVPTRIIRFGPGDRAEEEYAGNRDEIAEPLPIDRGRADDCYRFVTHYAGTTKPLALFHFSSGKRGAMPWPISNRRTRSHC